MGAKEREIIRQGIRDLSNAKGYEVYQGEVDSVDETQQTIDVKLNDDVIIPDVRLKVILNETKGFYVVPKKGSHVIIAQMDGGVEYCLLQASEIDKLMVKIGDRTLVIDQDTHVFDGGNNKGMLIVDKSVERWNLIEQSINELKQILTAWIPVAQDGGTALKNAVSTWAGQQLQETQAAQVENDKVKH